jgi:hypothetical protein
LRFRACSLLILALLTVSLPTQASEWYPLDTGRHWEYSGPGGQPSSATIGNPTIFAGAVVKPMVWSTGNRENLSQDGAGRVFSHGVIYPDGSYTVFDPPLLFMDSNLTPGHHWQLTYEVIFYTSSGVERDRHQSQFTCQVLGVVSVVVPAGTFLATEVLITTKSASNPEYSFHNSYAEGVGWIRRTNYNGTALLFELESYGPLMPTKAATWGGVKALYRE